MPYCHLVFTLPHELNALAAVHARWVYDTLMQCAAATLTDFAANPRWLGGTGAFTLVLPTWTQDLRRHLHVHALMACGAMQFAGTGTGTGTGTGDGVWIEPKRTRNFLFPVHALSRVFRGKFLQLLRHACDAGMLPRDRADTAAARQQCVQALRRHDWMVYAKTPLAGPAAVLDYLARCTHRTAIGNERLARRVRANGLPLGVPQGQASRRTLAGYHHVPRDGQTRGGRAPSHPFSPQGWAGGAASPAGSGVWLLRRARLVPGAADRLVELG